MNELYPLKFKPQFKDKIWGGSKIKSILNKDFSPLPNCGESWEISGVQGEISKVSNGFLKGNNLQEIIEVYMGDLVGDIIYEEFGVEFPLLIKFIDANDDLSIQVHPDDKLARERHNAYGKTEMWYIIEADKDSRLISGFSKKVTREDYLHHLQNKSLKKILNVEAAKPGDVFFMPAGRIHAIGKGILLIEIEQTSDITYRIYDWDRKDENGKSRPLHTDLAINAIDYNYYKSYKTLYRYELNRTSTVISCPYFKTNILEFDKPVEKDYNLIDSFIIYICIEGNVEIKDEFGTLTPVQKGETVLIPAILKNLSLLPKEKSKLLEVYIEK